jgi:hypothetical protein
MRIELDDGAWADIRDPRKLTGRQTELLEDAQFDLMATPAGQHLADEGASEAFQSMSPGQQMNLVGPEGLRAFRTLQRATVLAYVSAWSFGPTVTLDVLLDEVPVDVAKAIGDRVGEIVKATGGPKLDTRVDMSTDSPTVPSPV